MHQLTKSPPDLFKKVIYPQSEPIRSIFETFGRIDHEVPSV